MARRKKGRFRKAVSKIGAGGALQTFKTTDYFFTPLLNSYMETGSINKAAEQYTGYNPSDSTWDVSRAKPFFTGMAVHLMDGVGKKFLGHNRAISRGSLTAILPEFINIYEEYRPAVGGGLTFTEANNCYVESISGFHAGHGSWGVQDNTKRYFFLTYGGDIVRWAAHRFAPNVVKKINKALGGLNF